MKALKRIQRYFPLYVFLIIVIILWRGLSLHPNRIPSPLINKAVPAFQLPTIFDDNKMLTNYDFLGHITLLNVWATWCSACAEEHELLMRLVKNENVIIFGLSYKDDLDAARRLLVQRGNPYQVVAVDKSGSTAIDFGVYGTPETFVIDKKGIIRYKQIGPITQQEWNSILKPLIDSLRNEVT
jgi:cytochrome c biogenesis protein CcmG/thiol:disulfide interchange protein DsbE